MLTLQHSSRNEVTMWSDADVASATLELAGLMRERTTDESYMVREWVMNGLEDERERVVWGRNGEMKILDTEEAARMIQRFVRMMLDRSSQKEVNDILSNPKFPLALDTYLQERCLHGLPRGGANNPKGSFSVSRKSNKVLSEGFIFQKGGDHRYAVGMDATHYCPYYTILEREGGGAYHCICQCETLKEGLIYT